jgi:hypothetical protein
MESTLSFSSSVVVEYPIMATTPACPGWSSGLSVVDGLVSVTHRAWRPGVEPEIEAETHRAQTKH